MSHTEGMGWKGGVSAFETVGIRRGVTDSSQQGCAPLSHLSGGLSTFSGYEGQKVGLGEAIWGQGAV